ncbi:MAG: transglutaminase domain-containing protein, partial [Anaerolineales bacterium]|nr:transglutaminase domain-containing protein [Anaerolineales bacterium]
MFRLDEGWATVLLVIALVTVAAWGVEAPGWAPGLWVASLAGASGVLLGVVLSKSRFRGSTAFLLAAGYGLFVVAFAILPQLNGSFYRRSWELIIRINNFLYYALHGGTSRDILPFTVMVGLIFWAIGVTAAWSIFRRGSAWPAFIPGGLVLLINAYFYTNIQLELYLAAYLVLALLILARVNLLNQEREWRNARVAFSSEVRFEFLRAGLAAALAVVVIASITQRATDLSASPQAVAAWQRVDGVWRVVRENFERLFNAVRNPGVVATDFYGDSLLLGGPNSLTDRRLFDVAIGPVNPDDPAAEAAAAVAAPVPRYYWRANAYQRYANGTWEMGNELTFRELDANEAAFLPPYRQRRDVAATFISYLEAPSRLYVLPQPRLVDRPVMMEAIVAPSGALDPVSVRAQQVLTGDDKRYRVVASVSVADRDSLRNASPFYPNHIGRLYLQLPDSVTQRTRDLARQIVTEAGARTPFDQAQAITDWLRRNIEYDLAMQPPPQGVEPIDWFLFEYRRGYCNYYASAAVVMLRSLGIPARLAVGFSQGTFDNSTGVFVVRERNAHAWPEVYFPEYGWVEFEPTSSEAPLIRPERLAASTTNTDDDVPDPNSVPTREPEGLENDERDEPVQAQPTDWGALLSRWAFNLTLILGIIAVLLLIGLGVMLRANLIGLESLGTPGRRVLKWLGRTVPSTVTVAYLELERAARWLGLKLPASWTPRERAAALNAAFPEAQPAVDTITAEYVAEQYGPDPNRPNGERAQAAWRSVRSKVWR